MSKPSGYSVRYVKREIQGQDPSQGPIPHVECWVFLGGMPLGIFSQVRIEMDSRVNLPVLHLERILYHDTDIQTQTREEFIKEQAEWGNTHIADAEKKYLEEDTKEKKDPGNWPDNLP